MCLHKPSFEEEEERIEGNQIWFGRTKGSAILLCIPSILFFSVLDRRCCATCWGRDLKWVCICCLWKISPTLILVHAFIQKKTKMEINKDPTGFKSPGTQEFFLLTSIRRAYISFILFILLLFYCSHVFFMAKAWRVT